MESNSNAPKEPSSAINDSKNANLSFFDSDDDGNADNEHHWTFPHKYWVEWLWKEMQEQGFYQPHIRVRHDSKRERVFDGKVQVKVSFAVEVDVCVMPPTKIDFVNALFFI